MATAFASSASLRTQRTTKGRDSVVTEGKLEIVYMKRNMPCSAFVDKDLPVFVAMRDEFMRQSRGEPSPVQDGGR